MDILRYTFFINRQSLIPLNVIHKIPYYMRVFQILYAILTVMCAGIPIGVSLHVIEEYSLIGMWLIQLPISLLLLILVLRMLSYIIRLKSKHPNVPRLNKYTKMYILSFIMIQFSLLLHILIRASDYIILYYVITELVVFILIAGLAIIDAIYFNPKISRNIEHGAELNDDNSCPICTAYPVEVLLVCGHLFCRSCTMTYIEMKCRDAVEVKCPTCRADLKIRCYIFASRSYIPPGEKLRRIRKRRVTDDDYL